MDSDYNIADSVTFGVSAILAKGLLTSRYARAPGAPPALHAPDRFPLSSR